MKFPLGIHVGERLSLEQTWAQAEYAESMGFESVWVAEGRLARDGIVPAAVIASRTQRIRVGTGVVNGAPVAVPPGTYTVEVLSTETRTFEDVTVDAGDAIELKLEEAG